VSVADGFKRRLAAARERSRLFDHLIATFRHYSKVEGSVLAGAVTYFGFLSFFPIAAIGFAVVGLVTGAYPDAEESVTEALESVFPGLIGAEKGQINPASFEDAAATIGTIGLVTLLYTGLGWLSAMRQALQDVFEIPPSKAHNFFIGKVVDLVMLAVIGFVLVVSVAASSATRGFIGDIREALGIDDVTATAVVLNGVGTLFALVASMVMFVVSFRLLARPKVSSVALWKGALLAAAGFEVLKQIAVYLIAATKDNPAFAVFGTALILLVWINYFSRLVLIGASWAATADRTYLRKPAPTPTGAATSPERSTPDDGAPVAVGAGGAAVAVAADEDGPDEAEDRDDAAVEVVRAVAILIGVTWLLRRIMRSEE
jgi:membrane protein